ncbi:hypothetical protein NX059_008876 [Plenodomus lindquistii]|nr:hypothetical protein NX059_008876 [Plenodomus lindquistii]
MRLTFALPMLAGLAVAQNLVQSVVSSIVAGASFSVASHASSAANVASSATSSAAGAPSSVAASAPSRASMIAASASSCAASAASAASSAAASASHSGPSHFICYSKRRLCFAFSGKRKWISLRRCCFHRRSGRPQC